MTIETDRPREIYIPQETHSDGFRFLAGLMLAALKDYDCSTKKRDNQYTPQGDYIQILPDDPGLSIYACHLKAICTQAPKDQIIDALITPEGLILSYDNTRFNLKWQSPGDNDFIAVLHNGSAPEKIAPPPDPWLKRACSKDKNRPEELLPVWGNMATDGYRVHYDKSLEPSDPPFPQPINYVINPCRTYGNIAEIEVKPFAQAVKQARTINKDSIHIRLNGRLELIATDPSWNNGTDIQKTTIQIDSGYAHSGPDAEFAINPAFLLDALGGFTGSVILAVNDKLKPGQCPIYLTGGTREAFIMPMKGE